MLAVQDTVGAELRLLGQLGPGPVLAPRPTHSMVASTWFTQGPQTFESPTSSSATSQNKPCALKALMELEPTQVISL